MHPPTKPLKSITSGFLYQHLDFELFSTNFSSNSVKPPPPPPRFFYRKLTFYLLLWEKKTFKFHLISPISSCSYT